jgi:hypothetical protein
VRQTLEQPLVKLREIPIERARIAALDIELVDAAKYDRPKTVPLRLIQVTADRQLIRELREHRLDGRFHAKLGRALQRLR